MVKNLGIQRLAALRPFNLRTSTDERNNAMSYTPAFDHEENERIASAAYRVVASGQMIRRYIALHRKDNDLARPEVANDFMAVMERAAALFTGACMVGVAAQENLGDAEKISNAGLSLLAAWLQVLREYRVFAVNPSREQRDTVIATSRESDKAYREFGANTKGLIGGFGSNFITPPLMTNLLSYEDVMLPSDLSEVLMEMELDLKEMNNETL
jgi:hypothetical protein